ncbi:thiamine-phosphate kinase [Natronorarus salvus]|uniref:thiamine-phosphate kinase n=1 Tax=Natronorarus salvus TaxID=3117733 RepID=UPI002F26729C
MDERAALAMLSDELHHAGDDAAVIDGCVLTTDMLHETTDFPPGTTRYTAGWRAVGASLSDLAAMGAEAVATVAVYAAPEFDDGEIRAFVRGTSEVSEAVGAAYVGGDLDTHAEFTVATTALGRVEEPVPRSGASAGELVCVTGTLGRSAAGVEAFKTGDHGTGNELFRFTPRVATGRALSGRASAMMDSSDGLARSLHQLSEASDCGFELERESIPIDRALLELVPDRAEELAVTFGEDFELVFTIPEGELKTVEAGSETPIGVIGEVTDGGVRMDGEPLVDRGYTHE